MKKQLTSLNLLKGIGILMIIMVHNRHFIMKDMSGLRQLINYGQMGCQLFFMVSGMSLCYSWHNLIKKHGTGPSNLTLRQRIFYSGKFILRRYLRLAPGFIIILCVNYLLNILFIDVLEHSPGFIINRNPAAILTNVLFLHGLFPDYINNVFPGGWYIGTTFILYALFPALIFIFEKIYALNRRVIVIIPVILLLLNCIILRGISNSPSNNLYLYNDSFLYYFFTNHITCFSLGILLYFQEKTDFSSKCPFPVCAALFIITFLFSIYAYLAFKQPLVYSVLPTLAGLAFYWLAVCLIHLELHGAGIFTHKGFFVNFLSSCGINSYGMYLVHSFVSWYGMKDLVYLITLNGYQYNDLLLYCIVYIPSVLLICALGHLMKRVLDFIDMKLRS